MDIKQLISKFPDLLDIAGASAPDGDRYKQQEKLISECRESKQAFLASMPMRHKYNCTLCEFNQGESTLHFENPAPDAENINTSAMFDHPAGACAEILKGDLHHILVHGEECPEALMKVLLSIRS